MNPVTWKDRVFSFPAVLSDVEYDFELDSRAPLTLQMVSAAGQWRAVSWLPINEIGTEGVVQVGRATAIDLRGKSISDPLALASWHPGNAQQVFDLMPDVLCPIPGAVTQTCKLIRGLRCIALRQFMASVFTIASVFRRYWMCPASIAHHHAYPGGLALHSLEVAVLVSTAQGLEDWQHELLIVYALLHDIGKVWSYEDGALTTEARRVGHEQLGFIRLRSRIESLCESLPEHGALLNAMLSNTWKRDYKHPASALAGIVQAMDRYSAARGVDNVGRAIELNSPRKHSSWRRIRSDG